jgi:hypothetical protein
MAAKRASEAKAKAKAKPKAERKPKPKPNKPKPNPEVETEIGPVIAQDREEQVPPEGPIKGRDFTAELEALVSLTGGDFEPFIERVKINVGFAHESDALAAVNALECADYARLVARLKKETEVRIAPFEAALRAAKGDGAGDDDGLPGKPLTFAEIEPWPDPVDGAELLTELSGAIGSYVVMDKHQRDATALWAVFTHTHDLRDFAPLLIVKSAIKRSGKSRLAEIVERLAPRPLYIAGLTTSFIERAIEDHRCTLVIDEADRIQKGDQALGERIAAQYNRSFRRAIAKVGKNVPLPGGGYEPRLFSTWAATFIAGIGKQADTAEDRRHHRSQAQAFFREGKAAARWGRGGAFRPGAQNRAVRRRYRDSVAHPRAGSARC